MYYHKHCHDNQYPKLDKFNLKKIKFYVLIHNWNMNVIREIDGARNSNRERKYIYRDIKAPDNIAVINLCLSTN